jgi:hypothetical protein
MMRLTAAGGCHKVRNNSDTGLTRVVLVEHAREGHIQRKGSMPTKLWGEVEMMGELVWDWDTISRLFLSFIPGHVS